METTDSGAGGPGLEGRLTRLEEVVAALEREDLELEDALRLFEEGIGHLRAARETLRVAELRIEELVRQTEADLRADTVAAGRADTGDEAAEADGA